MLVLHKHLITSSDTLLSIYKNGENFERKTTFSKHFFLPLVAYKYNFTYG